MLLNSPEKYSFHLDQGAKRCSKLEFLIDCVDICDHCHPRPEGKGWTMKEIPPRFPATSWHSLSLANEERSNYLKRKGLSYQIGNAGKE